MLCAFSAAKSTALVLDSGAHHTTAVPIVDGHVLKKAVVRTPYGGDYISRLCYKHLVDQHIDIVPLYQVKSKQEVSPRTPAQFVKKNLPEGLFFIKLIRF